MTLAIGRKVCIRGEGDMVRGAVIAMPIGRNRRMALVQTECGYRTTVRIDGRGVMV